MKFKICARREACAQAGSGWRPVSRALYMHARDMACCMHIADSMKDAAHMLSMHHSMHSIGSASQVSVRAHMQTGGRSHDQRRLLTPNKKRKGGIPFLLKGVPVRGLVALPARLRPPPPVTVTDNFCDGRRGDTPFGRMRVRVVCSDQQVPMKNMISCMRTPCVARGPSQACQRARRASAQSHTRHAKPEAIGSWGRVRRTSYPNGTRAESQPHQNHP